MERQLIERIDVGNDCLMVYQCTDKTSVVIKTREQGDAEIYLDPNQSKRVIDALRSALDRDRSWSVWRQGDDGNSFVVQDGLTQTEANDLVADFEAKKHKQAYWATHSTQSTR